MAKKINYYVAVFIDILGQGKKLSKINKLPTTKGEEEEFMNLFLETAGAVEKLQKNFEVFFEGFQKISPEIQKQLDSFPPDKKAKFLKSKELNLQHLYFSDTVILYFTLDKESNLTPMKSIYSAVASAALTFPIMLSSGIPLRGAINIGIGTELDKSGIYGPILHDLHYLESKVAKYPRIIIGEELIHMINLNDKEPIREGDDIQAINKATIPSIRSLIKTDNDGENILNYLDISISESFADNKKDLYTNLVTFGEGQCRAMNGDEELSKRYTIQALY